MTKNCTVPGSVKPKGKPRGGSRKGIPNKVPKALKDMILGALDDAGGQSYLREQAENNPGPFLALIGKVLPSEINTTLANPEGGPLAITINFKRPDGKD